MEAIGSELVTTLNLLRAASMAERRVGRRIVHGLSLAELQLLLHLRLAPEHRLRRVDIAERLGMSQSSATRLLGPLERRLVVEREVDERDGRVVWARLTDAGVALVDEATAAAQEAAEELFDTIDDAAHAELAQVLRRLMAGLPGVFAPPAR